VIRQWFSAIHEALDDLIRRYPQAGEEEKYRIQEQWNVIKSLSDEWIEHWLSLEDKLALFRDLEQGGGSASGQPAKLLGPFDKGQGYFKLQMFEHASKRRFGFSPICLRPACFWRWRGCIWASSAKPSGISS